MVPRLRSAEYLRQYKIRVTFDDGKSGVLDLEDELWGEVFEPLRDIRLFRCFSFDSELGTIKWPTGADFSPEYLYENVIVADRYLSASADNGTIHRIRFPESLKFALRNERLVVFAGAGVSMGEPACLPNFRCLARKIAEGTGRTLAEGEPVDQFLGKLRQVGTNVHELAARELSDVDLLPTELHRDLLRFYPNESNVRIVTTNFDLLFELAAENLFQTTPEIFRAPALPLGHDFTGIVHVHGTVSQPNNMVLTDVDFGRAYLTEGWARRFLTDLFRTFTVLFVGYAHNDTIMRYLARAIPERQPGSRFVLTPQLDDDPERWQLLGVEPIPYFQASDHDHRTLYRDVRRLADYLSYSVLDWQREISDITAKPPPIGDDEIDLVEQALQDPVKTRFFTRATCLPEWIEWLNERKILTALFSNDDLSELDTLLAAWLSGFAENHADELFELVAQNHMCLHPKFWHMLGSKIGQSDLTPPSQEILSRWISLLIATKPREGHDYVFLRLGRRCIKLGMIEDLITIFDTMAESHLELKPAFRLPDPSRYGAQSSIRVGTYFADDHYSFNELWKGLKPSLAQVAEPLIKSISRRLEDQYLKLRAWQAAGPEFDRTSFRRSAIEPHKQDEFPETVDVLIDAARDCLERLAADDVRSAARWCELLSGSDVPLLRRLAVHTLYNRRDLTPNEKLDWLLTKFNIHDIAAHHETFRLARKSYPEASPERRRAFVDNILAYRWPNEDDPKKEMHTARYHFDWLDWLHKAASDCQLAKSELLTLSLRYPQWEPREHPDFTHWIGEVSDSRQSPWTVEQLLKRRGCDWIDQLLSFKQTEFDGPDRIGLLYAVQNASEKEFEWGFGLAQALVDRKNWDADLWRTLMRAWSTTELDENRHSRLLELLTSVELYGKHSDSIADYLYSLVKDGRKTCVLNLLPQTNVIACDLWHHLGQEEPPEENDDWLNKAINRPAGKLAEYWLRVLSIWRSQKDSAPKTFVDEILVALSQIVLDRSLSGRLGRVVLTAHFSFLVAIDEDWTRENILPLFYARDDIGDFQAAWHGFLYWGKLGPTSVELLSPAFFEAVPRTKTQLFGCRDRFVGYYVSIITYFVEDPIREWIPKLFEYADADVRKTFALEVWQRLRSMNDVQLINQWTRWIKPYWNGRLQGKPAPLETDEVKVMLEWLPTLQAVFPEAVELAVQMRVSQSNIPILIFEIARKKLWQKYPEDVARLLIHLGNSGEPSYMWHGGRELADKLLSTDLSATRKQGVNELIVRLDLR